MNLYGVKDVRNGGVSFRCKMETDKLNKGLDEMIGTIKWFEPYIIVIIVLSLIVTALGIINGLL